MDSGLGTLESLGGRYGGHKEPESQNRTVTSQPVTRHLLEYYSGMLLAGVWPPREGVEPRNPHQGSGWDPSSVPPHCLMEFPQNFMGSKIKKDGPQEEGLHPPTAQMNKPPPLLHLTHPTNWGASELEAKRKNPTQICLTHLGREKFLARIFSQ